MFEYLNGFRKTMYWTKKKMLSHADKYSQAFNKETYQKILDGKIPQKDMWKYSSFWYKDFDGMAFKTMLRQLISKWGIMSIEMQEAYTKDMAEIKENGDYDYIESQDIEVTNHEVVETNISEEKQEVNTQTVEQIEQNEVENSNSKDNSNFDDDFFN